MKLSLVTAVLNVNKAAASVCTDQTFRWFAEVYLTFIFILVIGIRWVPQYLLIPAEIQ